MDPECLDHHNPPPTEKQKWWGQDSGLADLQEKINTASCGEDYAGDCPGPRNKNHRWTIRHTGGGWTRTSPTSCAVRPVPWAAHPPWHAAALGVVSRVPHALLVPCAVVSIAQSPARPATPAQGSFEGGGGPGAMYGYWSGAGGVGGQGPRRRAQGMGMAAWGLGPGVPGTQGAGRVQLLKASERAAVPSASRTHSRGIGRSVRHVGHCTALGMARRSRGR